MEYFSGSLPIFTEYKTNGFQTVKYAQCWVFAGTVVTLCRAIGIPCRAITTLNAGGDGPKCDLRYHTYGVLEIALTSTYHHLHIFNA